MTEIARTKQSELTGVVIFVALVALGYAVYLYFSQGRVNTNEQLLAIGGLPTLVFAGFTTNIVPPPKSLKRYMTAAMAISYAFGVYLFGLIGCLGLGIALSEQSGWQAVALALLWIVLGWSLLKTLDQARRLRRTYLRYAQR